MRLIDADALIDDMCEDCGAFVNGACDKDVCASVLWVRDAPTIDAEPVRHGKWIKFHDELSKCSLCNYPTYTRWNQTDYCPNCGAKMERKNEDGID